VRSALLDAKKPLNRLFPAPSLPPPPPVGVMALSLIWEGEGRRTGGEKIRPD
jgi:hypothetical protein